ncbi:hypothetical protein C8Q74DRAFT_1217836 [Fomes fomentarius]|nr:hypothetical protein C8Q74DRAFT_1217836 [Fomes fomentarius]
MILGGLCKSAVNLEGTIAYAAFVPQGDDTLSLSEDSIQWAAQHAPSPYFSAMVVLCNSSMSCATPPTSTEIKMVEEFKKQWFTLMQKAYTASYQSPFAFSPSDRSGRILQGLSNPMISECENVLSPILPRTTTQKSTQQYSCLSWKPYFKEHPLPDNRTLLARVMLGSTKGTEKKKRTPNQAAESIVSAFARHFQSQKARTVMWDLDFLRGLLKASEHEYIQVFRVLYKSEVFWASLLQFMKRHAARGTNTTQMTAASVNEVMSALHIFWIIRYFPEFQEHSEVLIYNWLAGGLFEVFEAVLPAIFQDDGGIMFVCGIFMVIDQNLMKLSPKTRQKLRSELPRPRLQSALMTYANMGSSDPTQLLALWRGKLSIKCPFELRDPRHPVWAQGAWQCLMRITFSMRPWCGTCGKRGCDSPAYEGGCEQVIWQSRWVANGVGSVHSDDDHWFICKWVPVLRIVDQFQKRSKEEQAKLLGDGVAPPEREMGSLEDQLERMRLTGEMAEEELAKLWEAIAILRDGTAKEDDPIHGLSELQEALEAASLSDMRAEP